MTTNAKRLLAVLAHPDDETFGTGGTLALYARLGVEVHLACATAGEGGEAPPDLRGFASFRPDRRLSSPRSHRHSQRDGRRLQHRRRRQDRARRAACLFAAEALFPPLRSR